MVAAPKRAARRKPNVQYNEQESSELSDESLDSDSSPPRKKARGRAGASGPKGKKKGKATQTSKLLDMPLDVMFEVSRFPRGGPCGFRMFVVFTDVQILSCVEPRDLLQLSRTSKTLRGVIMDKSNRFVWVNSFAADEEAPKCPKDISEPAWAQLLYSPYCQVRRSVAPISIHPKNRALNHRFCAQHCHSSRATDIYWVSYRRLCKKCLPEVYVTAETRRRRFLLTSISTESRLTSKLWRMP